MLCVPQGLNLGAKDGLAKPFELAELEAHVKALLRRRSGHEALVHRFGQRGFDTVSRMFQHCGEPLALTPRDHTVLDTERAACDSVAFRFIAANTHFDHATHWPRFAAAAVPNSSNCPFTC